MKILIHTLNSHLYILSSLLTCSLGCSNIASHIHSRWFSKDIVNPVFINWLVKACIILMGIFFLPWSKMFSTSVWVQMSAVIPAILLGIFCIKIEYFILRAYSRKISLKKPQKPNRYIYYHAINNDTQGIAVSAPVNKQNLKIVHEHYARLDTHFKNYFLRDIILVAVCEEIIFRGYLYQFALLLHSSILMILALILTTLLFGASHITFGKGQFLSKSILGAFCLMSVVITNSILPAIIIHVVFNIYAYQEMRKVHDL